MWGSPGSAGFRFAGPSAGPWAYGEGVRAGAPSGSLADTAAQGTLTRLSWEVREEIKKEGPGKGACDGDGERVRGQPARAPWE